MAQIGSELARVRASANSDKHRDASDLNSIHFTSRYKSAISCTSSTPRVASLKRSVALHAAARLRSVERKESAADAH